MPWHQASPTAKAYYYRSVRSARADGQPRRQYVGGGPVGEAAATADARRRVEREIRARAWRREQALRDAALAPLLELIRVTDLLVEAALLAAGYHRHSRTWRKRRVPNHQPQDA
jgi:hypothetical protein